MIAKNKSARLTPKAVERATEIKRRFIATPGEKEKVQQ
jgi:hypothetical protein